jgi:hypothetical protein
MAALSVLWQTYRPEAAAVDSMACTSVETNDWEERAAVLEFEGGLSRAEAEGQAKRELAGDGQP